MAKLAQSPSSLDKLCYERKANKDLEELLHRDWEERNVYPKNLKANLGINTEQLCVYFQVRDFVSKALFNSPLSQIQTVKQLLTLINWKCLTS